MLKRFTVKNFKNFKDSISIDFENIAGYQFSTDCIVDGLIGKMLIYGRNATGKTNLGKAIADIRFTLFGGLVKTGSFLNVDSQEESAAFSYVFQFGDKELTYRYARYSEREMREEELLIDGQTIFRCDFFNEEYNFDNLKYIGAETANTERYLQNSLDEDDMEETLGPRLPFLRWLTSNVAFGNDSPVIRLSDYAEKMLFITVGSVTAFRYRRINDRFFEALENEGNLKGLEEFLNAMGGECKLVLMKLPDGRKELYFAHETKLLPFYESASSGTLALVDLYRIILRAGSASFLYLDEFDAFYHYEMAETVIQFFKKKYPGCQMIITTHNTNLMTNRLLRPDCLFILSRTGTLTALCNATMRELREGHNLEKMYISGEFEKYE